MGNRGGKRSARERAPAEAMALLLAGGDGRRLHDLTTEIAGRPIPKQYCRLYDNASLLEATLSRTRLYAPDERIHIIINRDHMDLALGQVCGLPEGNIIVQPSNRDTGPGLLLSLLQLGRRNPDATVAVFPTDHYIDDDQAFIAHIRRATRLVELLPEKIAVLGVAPDRPETGYGYLLPDSPVRSCGKTFYVRSFCEKPSVAKACEAIALGGLWNTFVMVFKLSRILRILKRVVPDRYRSMAALARSPQSVAPAYRTLQPWNFSTDVLTRIPEDIIMIEVDDVRWSDWGTRESIERTYRQLNRLPFWKNPLYRPIEAEREDTARRSQSIA